MSKGPIWARISGLFGRFFGNFWNFWGKCSLLGRWAWARTKKIGKINKKLPNLVQGLCTYVVCTTKAKLGKWTNLRHFGTFLAPKFGKFGKFSLQRGKFGAKNGQIFAPKVDKFELENDEK